MKIGKDKFVGAILRAMPFRDAGELHQRLKSGQVIPPHLRQAIRSGVRSARHATNRQ